MLAFIELTMIVFACLPCTLVCRWQAETPIQSTQPIALDDPLGQGPDDGYKITVIRTSPVPTPRQFSLTQGRCPNHLAMRPILVYFRRRVSQHPVSHIFEQVKEKHPQWLLTAISDAIREDQVQSSILNCIQYTRKYPPRHIHPHSPTRSCTR